MVKFLNHVVVTFVFKMDLITKSPGLFHIAEKIFLNLNHELLLLKCQDVNEYWGKIIRNPWFWYEKCCQKRKFIRDDEKMSHKKIIQALLDGIAETEDVIVILIEIFFWIETCNVFVLLFQ